MKKSLSQKSNLAKPDSQQSPSGGQDASQNFNYEMEYRRLSYGNLAKNQDFSNAPMFWSSQSEVFARALIIFAQISVIVAAFFFARYFFYQVVERIIPNRQFAEYFHLSFSGGVTLFYTLFVGVLTLLFTLPIIFARKAGFVHGWSVYHMVAGICYFIFYELFLVLALTISSIVQIFHNHSYRENAIYFIVATLFISFIWIIGASILLVKSDDARQKIYVE